MCGIAGFVDSGALFDRDKSKAVLRKMTDQIVHRGPDDVGHFVEGGVGFGHRRLAVIDLSQAGHQPMVSNSGRYVAVFNGEIYNYREIRKELESFGFVFIGESDTEVLLAAIEYWGVEKALDHSNGMLALALWDRQSNTLSLARDRAGEKPLYYGWVGKSLVFGSELKALRAFPNFDNEINREAVALQMRFGYIPAPHTIYRCVYKLEPGTCLTFPVGGIQKYQGRDLTQFSRVFWSFSLVVEDGIANPFRGNEEAAIEHLDGLLRGAVRRRMVSDVPLGALLSGGIDSSVVTAVMQAVSEKPVRTFSIGFSEEAYNEAQHARAVAKHLGTDHTELYVTPEEAMRVIPELPTIYDEPFSDSSQIPTYLVSKLARKHVTVALSGDAGDELFGGYDRYFLASKYRAQLAPVPRALRHGFGVGLLLLPALFWDQLLKPLGGALPAFLKTNPGQKIRQAANFLATGADPLQMYKLMCSHFKNPDTLVLGANEPATIFDRHKMALPVSGFYDRMMYIDFLSYLPGDILTKVDRASMATSLEIRCPLLDPKIISFAWHLPHEMKIRNGVSKWLLRQVLDRYVPRSIVERPKMGFGVPLADWLRGPMREWAESLLDARKLEEQGFFSTREVRDLWSSHISKQHDESFRIWNILMFQAWLESNKNVGNPMVPKDLECVSP